jgi:Tfp pilus assembly protein PilF
LKEYALEAAVVELNKAADVDPDDPEIYFHLACAYSVLEKTVEGFESLKKAVENRLPNTEMILNHDMLAFLRMHEAFEDFMKSNFTEYDKSLFEGN